MKEVKAFIRCEKAYKVVEALENLGISDMTIIDVMGIGEHLADPNESTLSIKVIEKYCDIVKVETVCPDENVHEIVETIRKVAYTSMKGDGMIYVSPVEMAVKIRTGAVGEKAL